MSASLYETDYQRWLEQTADCLQARDGDRLDWVHLLEEIESLGRSDKRAIVSYLRRLWEHHLKLAYWTAERERCFRGWDLEMANFRLQIQRLLADSPNWSGHLETMGPEVYAEARKLFLKASGLPAAAVPLTPEFSLAQALDEDWLPWQPGL
jgi:hypothetical protein